MEVDPPSPTTRFGIFFLIGAVTLIFIMWGVLKYFDTPHRPAPARQESSPTVTPTIPPLLARPSSSSVPP